MRNNLSISEILEQACSMTKKEEIVSVLQENMSNTLIIVLQLIFDDRFHLDLPEGDPPYIPSNGLYDHLALHKEIRKVSYLLKNNGLDLPQMKREKMFVGMLEMVHPNDAKLLLLAKDKKSPYKVLTKAIVERAFPGIFG